MFTPPECKTLKEMPRQQIRLGIQGFPKTGKTYAALTFPNPLVINLDRGLGAHGGRDDVIEVPLYDDVYCKSVNPNYKGRETLKDTIIIWFEKFSKQLEKDQTLVFDGGTALQSAYHAWYAKNQVINSNGKPDDFAQWRKKIEFFGQICDIFKTLRCDVVYICHEAIVSDTVGGKVRPLLTGQFANELVSHFSDWVRQWTQDKPKDIKNPEEKYLKNFGIKKEDAEEFFNSNWPDTNTMYFWQLESDDIYDGGVSSIVKFPRFIPANFKSFNKYMKWKPPATIQELVNE